MTLLDRLKAAVVEVIWVLWEMGYWRDSEILKKVHANWFPTWVDYKTYHTMRSVDRQIEEIWKPSEIDKPIFTEEEHGETLLGGSMELKSPWSDDDN